MQDKRKLLRPLAYLTAGLLIGVLGLTVAAKSTKSPDFSEMAECDNNWVFVSGPETNPGTAFAEGYFYQPCSGTVYFIRNTKATLVTFPK